MSNVENFLNDLNVVTHQGMTLDRALRITTLAERHFAPAPASGPVVDATSAYLIGSGHMILAIKRLREQHGMGLKEAKDACDKFRDDTTAAGFPAPSRPA